MAENYRPLLAFPPNKQMYAAWCAGCKALLPHLIQLAEADPSVHWIAVDYGARPLKPLHEPACLVRRGVL